MKKIDTKLVSDLIEFSKESMVECSKESEKSVAVVAKILDLIVQDAQRVPKMSQETLQAVKNFRRDLSDGKTMSKKERRARLGVMLGALKKLCSEDVDMNALVMPIIEALQFQDRIRQLMENTGKILSIWHEFHETHGSTTTSQEVKFDFGTRLMLATTTPEEKEAIQMLIPDLPEVALVDNDDGFFF